MVLKVLVLLILMIFTSTNIPLFAQAYEYREVNDPTLNTMMESMRAHQIQYSQFMFYSINVDTPGFVETGGYNRRLKNGKIKMVPFYRWRVGPIIDTGRELDFTVDAGSRGFFKIQLPNVVGYTRDGRFSIDSKRRLVMLNGHNPILGKNGIIYIPEGAEVSVTAAGTIYADDDVIDQFDIAVFTDSGRDKLVSLNGSVWILGEGKAQLYIGPEFYKIRQGYLEQNNVLKGIVGDIGMMKRSYEGSLKAAKVTGRVMNSAVGLAN